MYIQFGKMHLMLQSSLPTGKTDRITSSLTNNRNDEQNNINWACNVLLWIPGNDNDWISCRLFEDSTDPLSELIILAQSTDKTGKIDDRNGLYFA